MLMWNTVSRQSCPGAARRAPNVVWSSAPLSPSPVVPRRCCRLSHSPLPAVGICDVLFSSISLSVLGSHRFQKSAVLFSHPILGHSKAAHLSVIDWISFWSVVLEFWLKMGSQGAECHCLQKVSSQAAKRIIMNSVFQILMWYSYL